MSMTGRVKGSRALAPRVVRARNACVRHAAAQLGIEVPGDRELSALKDDTSLRDAVTWWRAQCGDVGVDETRVARHPVLLRVAVVAVVTLVGLAFSYRPVQ
jgi:hypothetical protein